ncbi:hypothetical protein D6T64_07615 [Cryobacterium melibiosiphilum]|uniref:Helix-hairpin-helix DNA-binding motif class 1 domain-containing protein n=1 Tax=Cryobacterium melibiosiphilum TaxID=995039 RepID=A0A3A5MN58_9MICO|nr:helix-hairpin-helix domain-containing protein [Cryobacterium melibiosiphilum]RJT89269.1 hypothetical protein D6T64_07615 [Cryobacterium melibiosiphilum]
MPVHEGLSPDTNRGAIGSPGDLDRLVPSARLREPVPDRVRLRVSVGAAIVLLLVALVVTVVVSAVGQQSGSSVIPADGPGPPGTDGAGELLSGVGPTDGTTGNDGAASRSRAIIFVHVLGAVQRPGLFELPDGARVIDAVAAAGGMTDEADPAGPNLARLLTDGEQLYLPRVGEIPAGVPPGASAEAASPGTAGSVVNLNTATVSDLDTLPRIGPAMAQRILDYRDANGPFASTDELRNITGIGDKTFEALKDLVTV